MRRDTYKRVVTTEGYGESTILSVFAHDTRQRFASARYDSGVFEQANRRIGLDRDVLELVVPIEVDIPAQGF